MLISSCVSFLGPVLAYSFPHLRQLAARSTPSSQHSECRIQDFEHFEVGTPHSTSDSSFPHCFSRHLLGRGRSSAPIIATGPRVWGDDFFYPQSFLLGASTKQATGTADAHEVFDSPKSARVRAWPWLPDLSFDRASFF